MFRNRPRIRPKPLTPGTLIYIPRLGYGILVPKTKTQFRHHAIRWLRNGVTNEVAHNRCRRAYWTFHGPTP